MRNIKISANFKIRGAIIALMFFASASASAQNFQSIVNNIELSLINNQNKIVVKGAWGEALIERLQLGYLPGTNNSYQLKISDAGLNPDTIGANAVLSKTNSYTFSAEQSSLIDRMDVIDTVSEENGKPVFQVIVGIYANKAISAKLGAIDKSSIEIIVEERLIPSDANSDSGNQFSNTTNNLHSQGQVTFNEDGTPYIVPDEAGGLPRRGLSNQGDPREIVPVNSSVEQSAISGQTAAKDGSDSLTNTDGSVSNILSTRNSNQVYVDESKPGPFGKILYENPAFLNLMILAPKKRQNDALQLSIVLNKERREEIQNKLGMSFRVVNVATLETPQLAQTTIFYRKKYLKPATIIADAIDGDQRILKMVNPNLKEGVDIEVIMGK